MWTVGSSAGSISAAHVVVDISAIYRRQFGKKCPHGRVCLSAEKSTDISVPGRYIGDISPIFSDFSIKQFLIAKTVSIGTDIRYNDDISEISILGYINSILEHIGIKYIFVTSLVHMTYMRQLEGEC